MTTTWVIDESAYETANNSFRSEEEAVSAAKKAAMALGRAISVYTLVEGVLEHAFKVDPAGQVLRGPNELANPNLPPGVEFTQNSPAVLGALDEVAEKLEEQGETELAAEIDAMTKVVSLNVLMPGPLARTMKSITDKPNLEDGMTYLRKKYPKDYQKLHDTLHALMGAFEEILG
jgi:hypothetical protein